MYFHQINMINNSYIITLIDNNINYITINSSQYIKLNDTSYSIEEVEVWRNLTQSDIENLKNDSSRKSNSSDSSYEIIENE